MVSKWYLVKKMENEIKKIIFLVWDCFSERDYNRFGIETIRQNGFEVEVWDFTPFLCPQVYKEVKISDPVNYEGYHLFLDCDAALTAISRLNSHSFIICIIGYCFKSHAVYRAISKNKIKYCVSMANILPLDPPINSFKSLFKKFKKLTPVKLFRRLKRLTPIRLLNALFLYIKFNYLGIQPAAMVLAGGEKSINYCPYPVNRKTEVLWLHALDYDIYLKEKDKPVQLDNNIGVFLDEDVPSHPDYLHIGVSPFSTPEEYYSLLCSFFGFLENKYGVRIFIAAHPRSYYEDHHSCFGGRPVIRGKTAELVRKAGFVILHSSTSINFPVLYKKPMIFITTNRLQQSLQGPTIDLMASLFGKKAINLNNHLAIDWEKELKVDEDAYRRYKNDYIKKDCIEDLPFWQIFTNRIKLIE